MYDACMYFYEEVFKIEFFGPLIIRIERYGKRVSSPGRCANTHVL